MLNLALDFKLGFIHNCVFRSESEKQVLLKS